MSSMSSKVCSVPKNPSVPTLRLIDLTNWSIYKQKNRQLDGLTTEEIRSNKPELARFLGEMESLLEG